MIAQPPDELLRVLERHGVPFVVIGGHAVNFHGYVRSTEDLDVIWLRAPAAERSLLAALNDIHAQWISDEIDPATRIEKLVTVDAGYVRLNHLMMLVTDHGFLDLFDYIPGFPDVDVQEVFNQSVLSQGIRYVSLPWLKQMKKAAGRPQDLSDLENLA